MMRCRWADPRSDLYVAYHDHEWGQPEHDDRKLFEMLILEGFQAGLSWLTILNKREAFRRAFDHFDIEQVCAYDAEKQEQLMQDPGIIRNRRKIAAAVNNARIFRDIQEAMAASPITYGDGQRERSSWKAGYPLLRFRTPSAPI